MQVKAMFNGLSLLFVLEVLNGRPMLLGCCDIPRVGSLPRIMIKIDQSKMDLGERGADVGKQVIRGLLGSPLLALEKRLKAHRSVMVFKICFDDVSPINCRYG